MLLAGAAGAAQDHPFFSRSRCLPPPRSVFAVRRAGEGSSLPPRALRWCRTQSRRSPRCRCHCSWSSNVHAHRSNHCRHCRAGVTSDKPDELPSGRGGRYHPSEDIAETLHINNGEPARLTDAESARTIVEVNNNATVMISTLIEDGVHERIILPEFPYLIDENGDIYFEVDNDDAVMESIMGEDKIAVTHVIIGLDNTDVFADLDLAAASSTQFTQEEEEDDDSDDEESDFDEDFEEEDVFAVDEEDGHGDDEDDDTPSWSNLETVNSCHPLYFARMIVESASKSSIDWLDRPPASLVVEGQLRPAFAEESTMVSRHLLNGDEPLKDEKESGATFFKVEVLSIELITAYGTEPKVKIEEYRKSRPDIIAHSAPNIISRLRASGDKMTQALKSLCWRCKAIQVEEAAIIGVDCLGFDLRLCSGTQVQTLRFAFQTKATSEFSAEKQIHELLFPRIYQEGQSPQAQQKES
ncbi:unnamed protein product [Alopecurus aequalis]